MADIDIDALLAPLTDAAPCGDELEYDAAFLALDESARGKPEEQFGDTVIAATEPDWRTVKAQALALLARTRDLRVGLHLLRAATQLDGVAGFAPAASVLHGWLAQHWERVYPLLDASDGNDATMRLSALAPLGDGVGVLATASPVLGDLRAASIGPARSGVTVRALELALGRGEAHKGEPVMSAASAVQAIADADAAAPGLIDHLLAAHTAVAGIRALLDAHVGAANGPDLRPLLGLTEALARAASQARGEPAAVRADATDAPTAAAHAPSSAVPGTISTREDATRALDRVCEWLERSEPTNPAPLLIRRAQRLMTKSFLDIIRDLAPDGLKEVERIAGVGD